MPFKSQKQARLFFAAAEDPKVARERGISTATAKKFIADSHGQKIGNLPQRVKKAEGGAVSSKPYCTAPTKW